MKRANASGGFTLIELLTVVAVLGILAAIIIPSVSGARDSANKATTKAQFSQWIAAMELFRQEYGYYPDIASGGIVDPERFAAELTGRTLAGDALSRGGGSTYGNTKRLNFYSLASGDLDETGRYIVDAFGNTEIGVRWDTNRDGRITSADAGTWAAVLGLEGLSLSPEEDPEAVPANGVRAGVVFYSAGLGRDTADMVLSWR